MSPPLPFYFLAIHVKHSIPILLGLRTTYNRSLTLNRNATTPNAPTFDRPNRLKGREEGIIRWGELLEKFRAVQERARRLHHMGGGGDLDDPSGGDSRIRDGMADQRGQGADTGGGGPGRGTRGPVPAVKETPPAKPEPIPKPRSGLGRQFGRLGGAVSGRGKRA